MPKTLKIGFTGSTVVTPPYPEDLHPVPGPLTAVMPGARHIRKSSFRDRINAQFAFLTFPYRHLVVESPQDRDADYKYPDLKNIRTGLCFLENEELRLLPGPRPTNDSLTFDKSSATDFPTTSSRGARYIARWEDFAPGGESKLREGVLTNDGPYVRIVVPVGEISAGFVAEPILRVNFDYGSAPETRAYAQKIVVTLTYPDDTTSVTFAAREFGTGEVDPFMITFAWYDTSEIEILFANGSLESMLNVLRESFVGQDHDGDYDLEFEVLYKVVFCKDDQHNRQPLPQIRSQETLRVPCIASMVASSGQTEAAVFTAPDEKAPSQSGIVAQPATDESAALKRKPNTTARQREPRERRGDRRE